MASRNPVSSKVLGRRIAELRELAGLKQHELSARLGKGQTEVSRWENGHVKPEYDNLVKIAEALGVDVSHLVTGDSPDSEAEDEASTPRKTAGETAGFSFAFFNFVKQHMDQLDEADQKLFMREATTPIPSDRATSLHVEWVETLRDIRKSDSSPDQKMLQRDSLASLVGRIAWAWAEEGATARAKTVASGDEASTARAAAVTERRPAKETPRAPRSSEVKKKKVG